MGNSINWDAVKFRCSSLGKLMTAPKLKSETLSETAKSYLLEVFIENKYGIKKEISSKYFEKGTSVEEDSITLYSLFKEEMFVKNESTFNDNYIKGTPDIVVIDNRLIDIKSCWDMLTFQKAKHSKINSDYYAQVQGYMHLTGKKQGVIAYCLTDMPDFLLEDEIRKMGYKCTSEQEYKEMVANANTIYKYGSIPIKEKVHEFCFDYDESFILQLHDKIKEARKFLATL